MKKILIASAILCFASAQASTHAVHFTFVEQTIHPNGTDPRTALLI